jgi:hypothetical protein
VNCKEAKNEMHSESFFSLKNVPVLTSCFLTGHQNTLQVESSFHAIKFGGLKIQISK